MSSFARTHTLMPMISRVFSRCTGAFAGVRPAGSRAIAVFAAAAILLGGNASLRLEGQARADALRDVSPTAGLVALHSASLHHLTLASRSGSRSSRVSSSVGAPLPARAHRTPQLPLVREPAAGGAQQCGASVDARGYDATAPPALS